MKNSSFNTIVNLLITCILLLSLAFIISIRLKDIKDEKEQLEYREDICEFLYNVEKKDNPYCYLFYNPNTND